MDILIEQLKRHEGFRSKPYKCSAGKLTIGYGRNLDDVGINQSEALELLRQDVARARKDVLKHISGADLLDDVRLNVLINMCFNLGIYKLLLFRKTLRAVQDFDFDKAVIRPEDIPLLDQAAEWLATHADVQVQIEGHCDERGTREYNLNLGQLRANAVKEYLATKGVDPNRLHTISYGEERPIDPGHTEDAWSKNRRVQFLVY